MEGHVAEVSAVNQNRASRCPHHAKESKCQCAFPAAGASANPDLGGKSRHVNREEEGGRGRRDRV